MRIGVTLPLAEGDVPGGKIPDFQDTLAFARHAESAGLDSIWVFDHLLFRYLGRPDEGIREAWTTLAALASAVPRVELGSLVMCSSFRNPALMAKMAATLDDLSGGRVILGLGSGWHDPEYEAFGYPLDHRVGRFAEDLEITARLLRGETVTVDGRWRTVTDAALIPPPVRRVPILVAAEGPRMLALTAAWADAWTPRGSAPPTAGCGRCSRPWMRRPRRPVATPRRSGERSASGCTIQARATAIRRAWPPTRMASPRSSTTWRHSASTTRSSGRSRDRRLRSTASPTPARSSRPGRMSPRRSATMRR